MYSIEDKVLFVAIIGLFLVAAMLVCGFRYDIEGGQDIGFVLDRWTGDVHVIYRDGQRSELILHP